MRISVSSPRNWPLISFPLSFSSISPGCPFVRLGEGILWAKCPAQEQAPDRFDKVDHLNCYFTVFRRHFLITKQHNPRVEE